MESNSKLNETPVSNYLSSISENEEDLLNFLNRSRPIGYRLAEITTIEAFKNKDGIYVRGHQHIAIWEKEMDSRGTARG